MRASRLTPTECAWLCAAGFSVTTGTPMNSASHVVVVPAYGNVSTLQIQRHELKEGDEPVRISVRT